MCIPEYCDSKTLHVKKQHPWDVSNSTEKEEIVFVVGDRADRFPENFEMCRHIVRDCKVTVILTVPFARTLYPKKFWDRDDRKRSALLRLRGTKFDDPNDVLRAYGFDGSVQTDTEEKYESKGSIGMRVHVWEHLTRGVAKACVDLFPSAQYTEDRDIFTERGAEYRRVRILSSSISSNVHVFVDRNLVRRGISSDRDDTIVLINAPYGGWCLENGLYSLPSRRVFTIDADAIGRITGNTTSDVLQEALKLLLKTSTSPRSDLSLYVEEHGLHEVSTPLKEKLHHLPSVMQSAETPFSPKMVTTVNATDEDSDEADCVEVLPSEALTASLDPHRLSHTLRSGLWQIRKNVPLTSKDYGRDLAHIELVRQDKDKKSYLPGQVLKVRPRNPEVAVSNFLSKMQWSGDVLLRIRSSSSSSTWKLMTVREHASAHIELFACPTSQFCIKLQKFVPEGSHARRQLQFLADNSDMIREQGLTYAAVLTAYKRHLRLNYATLVSSRLVPETAERSYSIASCADVVGSDQVDLIVVRETWNTCEGTLRSGLCSSFLCDVPAGSLVTAQVDQSTSLSVDDPTRDIVMIGFGTGIAPLRAFCQWYYAKRLRGEKTGEIILYFGARTSSDENMYGFEMFLLQQLAGGAGPIKRLRQAFSRDDPKKKVYVQHLMKEDREMISDFLGSRKGLLMLCGPVRPVDGACDVVSDLCGVSTEKLAEEGRLLVESY